VIIYAPDAERDVERLHAWYLDRSAAAAEAFMTRLALAEKRIEARPRAYRTLRDRETRRYSFKINRTSYLVDFSHRSSADRCAARLARPPESAGMTCRRGDPKGLEPHPCANAALHSLTDAL